jgi:hypothetical protein
LFGNLWGHGVLYTNLKGIFGGTVKNLDVVMRPSQDINRNWENVIKFPAEGKALKIESRY